MATVEDMVHVDLSASIGAIQIGTIFSIFLLGIVSTQCYYYVMGFWRTDGYVNKVLVSVLLQSGALKFE